MGRHSTGTIFLGKVSRHVLNKLAEVCIMLGLAQFVNKNQACLLV